MNKRVSVSNTQTTAYNTCTNQHRYMYGLEITPRVLKPALYRGIMGHEALASYYRAMMAGFPLEHCFEEAKLVLKKEIMRIVTEEDGDFEKVAILKQIQTLLEGYMYHYGKEPFKVLAVEEDLRAPITDEIEFGMILDLLVEMTAGEYKGSIIVVDHKFVYNFKSQIELGLDGQLPKYIKTARANGFYVTRGVFNQIRYRDMKEPNSGQIYQRTPLESVKKEWDQIWKEQSETAIEIITEPRPVRRTLNSQLCKGCDFANLCKAELRGEDITLTVNTQFKKRERPLKDVGTDAA